MIINAARTDPTRTATLRRQFIAALTLRYRRLKEAVREMVYERDAFGLGSATTGLLGYSPTPVLRTNAEPTSPSPELVTAPPPPLGISTPGLSSEHKVKRFRAWLRDRTGSELAGDALIQEYIDAGYRKGTERAFDDLRRGGVLTGEGEAADLKRQGAKEEFTRIAMTKAATVDKVKLLAGRTFAELDGINSRMAARMSRVLVDAMVLGWSPAKATREMLKVVDVDANRAAVIVRTELVRAHAEGQLDALEQLGETQVGVMAEWVTAHDSRVCPKCRWLDGQVMKIGDARGMIPMHPNCRCAWIPLKRKKGRGGA